MSRNSATSYTGLVDCLHKTYKFEGMRGLYRGFAPGLIGTSYGAFQITLYDRSKFIYAKWKNKPLHEPLSVAEYILLSSSSKMLATTIMFPYQVVRVRLQDHNRQWFGVRDVVKTTWNGEGLRGFYRGLVPNLLRVTPHTALTLTIYEYVQHYFK